jgi:hypothetical protein
MILPTTVPETATPEPDVQQVEPTPIAEVTLPSLGTIVAPATEDPSAGLIFDLITLTQTGGPSDITLTIELRKDGTLIRNGETSTVSQTDIVAIDTMLDELDFFGLTGVFAAAAPNPDVYAYQITVERDGASRMINAQDTYSPTELKALFAAIINLGQQTSPPPGVSNS